MVNISTKSELANYFLDDIKNNKKISILNIYKGNIALKKIKKLFFGENKIEANKWSKSWSSYNKSQCIFVVYTYKKSVNLDICFKFIIGDKKTGSILGEKYNYNKGMEKIQYLE